MRGAIAGIVYSTTLISILAFFFEPRWETNDDVGMSMIADRYGHELSTAPEVFSMATTSSNAHP